MRFNGIDPTTLHHGISVSKEYPPGMPGREVVTVRGMGTETLGGVEDERSEYRVVLNIAGKNKREAMEMRARIAKWARSSGESTAKLEPTHWIGKAYDAIVAEISEPEFVFGFGTVDVIFLLPDGRAYSTTPGIASGTGKINLSIGGSEACTPVISQTIDSAREGLVWQLDGAAFLTLKGGLTAGQVVAVDFAEGGVTIDGVHAENRINYMATSWKPGFLPGYHSITSTDGGTMTARWHDKWA